jgi:hypothetical protein
MNLLRQYGRNNPSVNKDNDEGFIALILMTQSFREVFDSNVFDILLPIKTFAIAH